VTPPYMAKARATHLTAWDPFYSVANMKPGDMIEWRYESSDKPIARDEYVWSSVMNRWLPIGGVHLLISRDNDELTWLYTSAGATRIGKALVSDSNLGRLDKRVFDGCYPVVVQGHLT